MKKKIISISLGLRCAEASWEGSKGAGWDSHLQSVEDVFGGGGGPLIHAGLTGRWAVTLEESGGRRSLCLGPQASGMHVSTWMEKEKDTHPWMGRQREREREREELVCGTKCCENLKEWGTG